VSSWTCVILTEEGGDSEGKLSEDKIQALLVYYLNLYAVIYLQLKLQLKFMNKKTYFFYNLKFA